VAGKAREFGVSGLLYNSDVLLYDRQSESLWSQIMSTAVSGPPERRAFEKATHPAHHLKSLAREWRHARALSRHRLSA
jgi:hypothetical protein